MTTIEYEPREPNKQDIAAIVSDLDAAQDRILALGINEGWDAIQGRLFRTYKRGYRDFSKACEQPKPERLHE